MVELLQQALKLARAEPFVFGVDSTSLEIELRNTLLLGKAFLSGGVVQPEIHFALRTGRVTRGTRDGVEVALRIRQPLLMRR